MSFSLLDLFNRLGSRPYDWMYRRGAPWESGPRPALVELCDSGRISAERLAPARAVDLGCGTGVDSVFLARRGFDVTGVDFSEVAIERARTSLRNLDFERLPRFAVADILTLPDEVVPGPFDLLFDDGSLDDFASNIRPQVAESITALARPGSVFVMWCFFSHLKDLPRISFTGASRWGAPPIEPGEQERLFGKHWDIERYVPSDPQPDSACFVMTRR